MMFDEKEVMKYLEEHKEENSIIDNLFGASGSIAVHHIMEYYLKPVCEEYGWITKLGSSILDLGCSAAAFFEVKKRAKNVRLCLKYLAAKEQKEEKETQGRFSYNEFEEIFLPAYCKNCRNKKMWPCIDPCSNCPKGKSFCHNCKFSELSPNTMPCSECKGGIFDDCGNLTATHFTKK